MAAAGQQILANNAPQIIAQHGPVGQIYQKMVMVFHGKKDFTTVIA